MDSLTSIVAVNHNKVIGAGNALPWRLRSDLRFFREQTLGNVVLMGRKTYESLGKRPLQGRYNVVVSHNFGLFDSRPDCTLATGIDDALYRASKAQKLFKGLYVIGGASMYEQFSSYVDRYLITLVDKDVPDGDTYFDDSFLRNGDEWNLRELFRCPAGEGDETSFSVFEAISRTPSDFRERRRAAIERAEAEATAGFRKKARYTAVRRGPDEVRPAYLL